MEELNILSATLSIASSVMQISRSLKCTVDEAIDNFKAKASDSDRLLLEDESIRQTIIGLEIISQPLLRQLSTEAKDCEDTHIRARRRARTQGAKKNADIQAAECMCGVLRDVRSYNGGNLPLGPMQTWWKAYNCKP